jgi:AraC-like DNA-binding protein
MRPRPGVRGPPYDDLVRTDDARLQAAGYREWLPPAGLRASLACLWVSVVPPDAGMSVTQVMPDGCVDLIWQSDCGAYVAGPDTGPIPAELPAGTFVIGARFRPGAAGPALGLPMTLLRDQRVDLANCLPALARKLPADLPPASAIDLVTALATRLVSERPPDPLVLAGTRILAGDSTSVTRLSAELAVSERQLRRRFDAAVGYGPKMLQRVLRFRRVLASLPAAVRDADLAGLAYKTGFADQAHLTRELATLGGLPPAALARTLGGGPAELVRY